MSNLFEGNDISFVFLDILNGIAIVYRDIFGKRSLVLSFDEAKNEIIISSLAI
jgi:hypothetical protein